MEDNLYDLAVSFAGEQRDYVLRTAMHAKPWG